MSKNSEPVILGFAYFDIDGTFFPFEQWIDNLSFLMCSWLKEIYKPKSLYTFTFMEGPYGFYLERNGVSSELVFYEGNPQKFKEVISLKIDFESFKSLLIKTAIQYVQDAIRNGFQDDELREIEAILNKLSQS